MKKVTTLLICSLFITNSYALSPWTNKHRASNLHSPKIKMANSNGQSKQDDPLIVQNNTSNPVQFVATSQNLSGINITGFWDNTLAASQQHSYPVEIEYSFSISGMVNIIDNTGISIPICQLNFNDTPYMKSMTTPSFAVHNLDSRYYCDLDLRQVQRDYGKEKRSPILKIVKGTNPKPTQTLQLNLNNQTADKTVSLNSLAISKTQVSPTLDSAPIAATKSGHYVVALDNARTLGTTALSGTGANLIFGIQVILFTVMIKFFKQEFTPAFTSGKDH